MACWAELKPMYFIKKPRVERWSIFPPQYKMDLGLAYWQWVTADRVYTCRVGRAPDKTDHQAVVACAYRLSFIPAATTALDLLDQYYRLQWGLHSPYEYDKWLWRARKSIETLKGHCFEPFPDEF